MWTRKAKYASLFPFASCFYRFSRLLWTRKAKTGSFFPFVDGDSGVYIAAVEEAIGNGFGQVGREDGPRDRDWRRSRGLEGGRGGLGSGSLEGGGIFRRGWPRSRSGCRERSGRSPEGGSGGVEVGDGAGDLDDTGVGAGRKAKLVDELFQHVFALIGQRAELLQLLGVHLCIYMYAAAAEALELDFAGEPDPAGYLCR